MKKTLLFIFLFASILNSCSPNLTEPPASSPNQSSSENLKIQDGKNKISIKVKTEDAEDLEVFEDGVIPWISVKNPNKNIERLIGRKDVVLKCDSAVLIIDYPLNNPAKISIKPSSGEFTREELVKIVSKEYNRIYKEEEESAKTKTVPLEERKGLINRNQTDGKYGIWGHDIDDLDLSNIIVHRKNGQIILELYIES
jgi:hypothetical protein